MKKVLTTTGIFIIAVLALSISGASSEVFADKAVSPKTAEAAGMPGAAEARAAAEGPGEDAGTSSGNVSGSKNTGFDPGCGCYRPIKGSNSSYSGPVTIRTRIKTQSDGTQIITRSYWKPDCDNWLFSETEIVDGPNQPPGTNPPGGGGGGCCCTDAVQPPAEPFPGDADKPADNFSIAYAYAAAFNVTTGDYHGGSNYPFDIGSSPDSVVDITQEQADFFYKDTEGFVWAIPGDQVGIEVVSKAAYIDGHTKAASHVGEHIGSYAKVTTDLGRTENPRTLETREDDYKSYSKQDDPVEIFLDPVRVIVAEDVGRVFTGIAHAKPAKAQLTWTPNYGEYVMGHKISGYSDCEDCETDDEGYDTNCCEQTCIAGWEAVKGSYIASWSPLYQEEDQITKVARIYVPFNYDIDIPEIEPCVEVAPFRCHEWLDPNVVFAGEDQVFEHEVTINAVHHEGMDRTYATNSKPSTYEIISFVLSPGSETPGRKGISEGYWATTPESNDSCGHYTDHLLKSGYIERNCEVVQREVGVFFNTAYNLPEGGKGVNTDGGQTDNNSYDVDGNFLKSLSPSIIVDDNVPIGSKICVAISVWPASSKDGIGRTSEDGLALGSDLNAQSGGHWSHGKPHCRTIAKKPNTQFWGAGVYSEGSISTSQSVKYVPYESGFTASQSNPGRSDGLSSDCSDPDIWNYFKNGGPAPKEYMECLAKTVNDNSARRAFGSWGEYEVISNKSIKGIGSGASLGYKGVSGEGFLSKPGGFPDSFPASDSFTSNRICYYSSQTFSNAVGAECKAGSTQGNSNISTNTDLTIERIISRYATDSCTGLSEITLGKSISGNCPLLSPDGKVKSYSSDSSNVTLTAPSKIPKGTTYTVTVPGKLTIDSDIIYEDVSYDNISDLPQVVIIADSIDVSPNVHQIDAWLVVGQNNPKNDDDTGVLNTCKGFEVGTGSIDAGCNTLEYDEDYGNYGLLINGPVFAKKLALNRTAGAGAGYSSIDPAERFNLRADSYLWAYAQAQRYSQAVVTYSRELAPRY